MKQSIKDIYMYALGALVVIGFFVVLGKMIVSEVSENTLNLMIGALISTFTGVVMYFFGSSKGSSDKNEMLNKK